MQDFSCGNEKLVKIAKPESKNNLEILTRGVHGGSLFGFTQVDIEATEALHEKFSEMPPLFLIP